MLWRTGRLVGSVWLRYLGKESLHICHYKLQLKISRVYMSWIFIRSWPLVLHSTGGTCLTTRGTSYSQNSSLLSDGMSSTKAILVIQMDYNRNIERRCWVRLSRVRANFLLVVWMMRFEKHWQNFMTDKDGRKRVVDLSFCIWCELVTDYHRVEFSLGKLGFLAKRCILPKHDFF